MTSSSFKSIALVALLASAAHGFAPQRVASPRVSNGESPTRHGIVEVFCFVMGTKDH